MENIFKVPKKVWKTWTKEGKESFNTHYPYFKLNQDIFLHPKGYLNSEEHWNTTAWNMAWMLADAVSNYTNKD